MFGFGSFGTGRLHFFNSTFTVYWTWTMYFLSVKKEHLRNLIFSINYKHGKWTYTVYTYKKNLIFILFLIFYGCDLCYGSSAPAEKGPPSPAPQHWLESISYCVWLREPSCHFERFVINRAVDSDLHRSAFIFFRIRILFPDSDPGGEI